MAFQKADQMRNHKSILQPHIFEIYYEVHLKRVSMFSVLAPHQSRALCTKADINFNEAVWQTSQAVGYPFPSFL